MVCLMRYFYFKEAHNMRDKRLLIAAIGVTLLVMLVLSQVVIAPPAFAKAGKTAKIAWSSKTVNATLAPSSTFSTTVTFVSTADLENVTLRLTPSLKGTTTISPTTFATITAGVPYSVEISVTIPEKKWRPANNGVLTLRTGSKAYAMPLPLRFRVKP